MSVSASGNYGITAAASIAAEVVSLHGTVGSPVILFSGGAVDPGDDTFGTWLWAAVSAGSGIDRGQVQKRGWDTGGPAGNYTSVHTSTDWVIPNDFQDGPYYLRARFVTGTGQQPDSVVGWTHGLPLELDGDADPGDWTALTNGINTIAFTWSTSGFTNKSGTIRVDISDVASNTGILSTGYYRVTLEPEP